MGVQNKMNLQTAPIRTYLDSTVVPVLLLMSAPKSSEFARAKLFGFAQSSGMIVRCIVSMYCIP